MINLPGRTIPCMPLQIILILKNNHPMYLKKLITLTVFFLTITGVLAAQSTTLTLQNSSELRIDGDSNVRSWGADANVMNGTLILTGVEELTLESLTPESIQQVQLNVVVEELDSGTGGLNKNMYKYLKGEDYPNISFELSEITSVDIQDDRAMITATGVINAAGKDHEITMNIEATSNGNAITFIGEQDLLMTNFDIDPPTAVFGTVRSHDEIKIKFNTTFSE